ncbi:MAG: hypothetical protein AB7V32_07035, partial [Candidatus Berkiella sp.]
MPKNNQQIKEQEKEMEKLINDMDNNKLVAFLMERGLRESVAQRHAERKNNFRVKYNEGSATFTINRKTRFSSKVVLKGTTIDAVEQFNNRYKAPVSNSPTPPSRVQPQHQPSAALSPHQQQQEQTIIRGGRTYQVAPPLSPQEQATSSPSAIIGAYQSVSGSPEKSPTSAAVVYDSILAAHAQDWHPFTALHHALKQKGALTDEKGSCFQKGSVISIRLYDKVNSPTGPTYVPKTFNFDLAKPSDLKRYNQFLVDNLGYQALYNKDYNLGKFVQHYDPKVAHAQLWQERAASWQPTAGSPIDVTALKMDLEFLGFTFNHKNARCNINYSTINFNFKTPQGETINKAFNLENQQSLIEYQAFLRKFLGNNALYNQQYNGSSIAQLQQQHQQPQHQQPQHQQPQHQQPQH